MKGKEAIENAVQQMRDECYEEKYRTMVGTEAHIMLLEIHSRALACHCECLAMNAENMWAAIANATPPYTQKAYLSIMVKWGLVDEKGMPTI
jgi:hypothetical protein